MSSLRDDEIRAVQKVGYQALLDGKLPRDNPYPWSDNEKCLAWNGGYAWSRTDKTTRMIRASQRQKDEAAEER